MTYEAIQRVLRYCEETKAQVQITGPDYDYKNNIEWVADFKNQIHANVCYEEMELDLYKVKLNPTIGNIEYYARIV